MKRLILAVMLSTPAAAWASTKDSYMHYLKALLYSNQNNGAEALKEYDAALAIDPQSTFVYQQAAELALQMGRTDRALELAQRFTQLSPKDHSAFFLLGKVRWARGEWKEAQAAFEKTLALKPDFKEALFTMGTLLSTPSPERAKKYLEEYLKGNPDNASQAEYEYALIEEKLGRKAEAVKHLKASSSLDPDNPQPVYALAQIYEVAQDTAAALAVYEDILQREPHNAALLNHIGELNSARGDSGRAREFFLRAKAVLPDNPAACLWLAILAEQDGDFDSAAAYIKDSADLKDDPATNLRLSYYLTQANHLKKAVDVLEKAHKKWPANADVTYFLALGYDDLKETSRAIESMKEVLKARPDHRDALFHLGALYEKQGDIKDAEEEFRAILKDHPDDSSALNYLGYSLADRGLKLEEAETLIRRAVDLDPKNGAYMDSLGWVQFKRGRYAAARKELEESAKLLSDDDTLWDHLGEVYSVLGDTAAAWESWRNSFDLAADKGPAAGKLARVERGLEPEALGRMVLQYLEKSRGRLSMFGGPCTIEGKIGPAAFRFQAIVQFKAPEDLTVEILGPLFVPMFHITLFGEDGFMMDSLGLPGISPDLLHRQLYGALRLVRGYLDGRFFRGHPARLLRHWRSVSIETPAVRFSFPKPLQRVGSVKDLGEGGCELSLEDYRPAGKGHWLPATMRLDGPGFSLKFQFPNPSARFD